MAKENFRDKNNFSEKIFVDEIWEIFLGRVRETSKNVLKKITYDLDARCVKWIRGCVALLSCQSILIREKLPFCEILKAYLRNFTLSYIMIKLIISHFWKDARTYILKIFTQKIKLQKIPIEL